MITPIVVVVLEPRDRDFQVSRNIVRDVVDVKFNGPVIPLQLAVGLRMEGRSQNVADARQPQVFSEGMRDITWPSSESSLMRRSKGTLVMPVRSTESLTTSINESAVMSRWSLQAMMNRDDR